MGYAPARACFTSRPTTDRLAPVAFTGAEATALLAAEKLAVRLADAETAHHVASAMDKVRSVLRPDDRDHLEAVAALVAVLVPRTHAPVQPDTLPCYPVLLAAATACRVVRLHYQAGSTGKTTVREVEPLGLVLESRWTLVALCRLRGDVRSFRLDRIGTVDVLDETYEGHPKALVRYRDAQEERRREVPPARVRFGQDAARVAADAKRHYGWVGEEITPGGEVEITFRPTTLKYLAAWLLAQAAGVTVVEPPDLLTCLRDLAYTAQNRFSRPRDA